MGTRRFEADNYLSAVAAKRQYAGNRGLARIRAGLNAKDGAAGAVIESCRVGCRGRGRVLGWCPGGAIRSVRRRSVRGRAGAILLVLSEAAELDALTGLPNRRACADALTLAAGLAEELRRPLSVALVDVDHFKAINDSYGHPVGGEVLRVLARRFRERMRSVELVGRWGGEEFLAVLPDAGPSRAAEAAEALRTAGANQPVVIDGLTVPVTVTVGWACGSDITPDRLVELADAASWATARSRSPPIPPTRRSFYPIGDSSSWDDGKRVLRGRTDKLQSLDEPEVSAVLGSSRHGHLCGRSDSRETRNRESRGQRTHALARPRVGGSDSTIGAVRA